MEHATYSASRAVSKGQSSSAEIFCLTRHEERGRVRWTIGGGIAKRLTTKQLVSRRYLTELILEATNRLPPFCNAAEHEAWLRRLFAEMLARAA